MHIRYDHIGKGDRPPSPTRRHNADQKGFEHDREKRSRKKLSASSPTEENPCLEKPSAPNGDETQQVSPLVSLRCEGRLIAGAA